MLGVGFAIQGVFPSFLAIMIAQFFYGSGWTFISGAEDAWLADEIGNDGLAHAYLRGKQVGLVASFLGIFSSVALGSIALSLPYLMSGLSLMAVAGLLVVLMPETNFHPVSISEQGAWSKMRETLFAGLGSIRMSPLLITVLVITLIYGISREGIDRLWEAHILAAVQLPIIGNLSMVVWFGIINAIAMLVALILSFVLQRWIKSLGTRQALIWLVARYALLGTSIVAFALTRSFRPSARWMR